MRGSPYLGSLVLKCWARTGINPYLNDYPSIMMFVYRSSLFMVCLMLGGLLTVYGQRNSAFEQAKEAYTAAYGNNQLLANGKVYGYLYPQIAGKHFLSDASGNLSYDGADYPRVNLHYDLYNDLVFVKNFQGGADRFLILRQDRVTAFRIGNRQFVRLLEAPDSLMDVGIHQLAFDQNGMKLYVKKRLKLDENPSSLPGGVRAEFLLADTHYLIRENMPARIIRNKKDLLLALSDFPDVKKRLKSNQIFITPRKEGFTGQLVQVLSLVAGIE